MRLLVLGIITFISLGAVAESIVCNNGDMKIEASSAFSNMGWYELKIEEDGVANYLRDQIGRNHDGYNGVFPYSYDSENQDVTFLLKKGDGEYSMMGEFNTYKAIPMWGGILLEVVPSTNDNPRNRPNWFFESCQVYTQPSE